MSDNEIDQDEVEPHYEIVFNDAPTVKDSYLRRDGQATVKFANGDSFEGSYIDGKRHGQGVYTYANKAIYTGEYVAGQKEGQGEMKFPDQSVYQGEWRANRRHGQGKYVFPNGDIYEGGWQRGLKHGKGVYTFSPAHKSPAAPTCVRGQWSNGKLLDGEWNQHGGAKLIGRFMNNQPNGHSVFVTSKGVIHAGTHQLDSETKTVSFTPIGAPAPASAKAISQTIAPAPSALTLANRALEVVSLNADLVEGAYRLKKSVDGAPNYRRIDETNVFVSGQASIEGLKSLVGAVGEAGFDRTTLVVCRSEPIIYVGDHSYTSRHPKRLHTPMRFPDLTVDELASLEQSFASNVATRVQHTGGLIKYNREVYADLEQNRRGIEVEEDVGEAVKIASLQSVINTLAEEEGLSLSLIRNPMNETGATIDELGSTIDRVRALDAETGLVFVDWLGRENATIAAVVALANKQLLNGFPVPEAEKTEEEEKEEEDGSNEAEKAEDGADQEGTEEDKVEDEDNEEEDGEEPSEENTESGNPASTEEPAQPAELVEPAQPAETVVTPEPAAAAPEPVVVDEKRGVFSVTQWVVSSLVDGAKAKEVADSLIDQAAAAVNLRECVFHAHQEWREANQNASTSSQASLWLNEARVAVERYILVIAAVAFLAAVRPVSNQEEAEADDAEDAAPVSKVQPPTFRQWLSSQIDLSVLKQRCQLFAWD